MRTFGVTGLVICLVASSAFAQEGGPGPLGKKLYDKYCSQCHGINGDGKGVAYPFLKPEPRDFTSGKYKIRTTPSGSLPTDQDLRNIIQKGMPYTSMPAWLLFNDQELEEIVDYVKSFSEDFADPENVADPIELPSPPEITQESVEAGRIVYEELGCAGCHGEVGRGDGLSAPTLKDDWGNHLLAADLTKRWTFRGGPTRQDIFRAFSTGLNGTPMPSYFDSLEEEQRWDLVNYIHSLGRGDGPGYSTMVTARKVRREIDLEQGPELFEGALPAHFPVVGQIQQPGREFHPSGNVISVRAVYNESDIAFELRWHDMRTETSGNNAPDLKAPAFEFDPYRGAASAPAYEEEGTGDDFWGEEAGEEEDDFWGEGEEGEAAATRPDTEFSDAVAIQFPLQIPKGMRKPYFIFGDLQNSVDLWFLDLAGNQPEQFVGRGSDSLESQGVADLTAVAGYDQGEWRVIFKRSLRAPGGVPFDEGQFVPVAFSVWDGFNRERGNKRGLTSWFYLYLDPGGEVSSVGPMAWGAGITLGIEVLLVVLLRRRFTGSSLDARIDVKEGA